MNKVKTRNILFISGIFFAGISIATSGNEANAAEYLDVGNNIAQLDAEAEQRSLKEYGWAISIGASISDFTPVRDNEWKDNSISIRHYFSDGSIALESLNAERYGDTDTALALDAYVPLWSRAYANLRFQHASSPTLFPVYSWRTEIYQGVNGGWEISGSYDELSFGTNPVKIYSVGIGKYIGDFYLRLRQVIVPGDNGNSSSQKGVMRYYFKGDADNYFELNSSIGRDDDPLVLANGNQNRDSLGIAFVYYPVKVLGYKLGCTYSRESNSYSEREIFGALYYRW